MKFFESEFFLKAFCQNPDDKIYYYNGKPSGVIKKGKIFFCEVGPFGTWTHLNRTAEDVKNIIDTLLNEKVKKIYFTDIDNVLANEKNFLSGKVFDKSLWYQSDFIIDGKSKEEALKVFDRNRRRNYKKYAGKDNVEIVQDNSLVDVFYEIFVEHQKVKGYTSLPCTFFKNILTLKNFDTRDSIGAKLYMLKHNGNYIAGEIVVFDTEDYYCFVHALSSKAYELHIDDFFRMEIIFEALKFGKKRHRFGATRSDMVELLEYKRRYGTVEVPFSVYCFYSNRVIKLASKLSSAISKLRHI